MKKERSLTYHCQQRLRDRKGLSKKHARSAAQNALQKGLEYNQIDQAEVKNYLRDRTSDDAIAIAYNGTCYIVDRQKRMCITAWPLPFRLTKKFDYDKKLMIKNRRRYDRMRDIA